MFCSCALFFCFKQKTAYEMRISDWSSDVCSSDLLPGRHRVRGSAGRWRAGRLSGEDRLSGARDRRPVGGAVMDHPDVPDDCRVHAGPYGDRKSVAEGKSVSVRVDLGGRRIIKKKNRTLNLI